MYKFRISTYTKRTVDKSEVLLVGSLVRKLYYLGNPEIAWNSMSCRVDKNVSVRMQMMGKRCIGELCLVLRLERSFFPESIE